MATIIKNDSRFVESGTSYQHIAYDLSDFANQAERYLADVRAEASKIIQEANAQADKVRQQA